MAEFGGSSLESLRGVAFRNFSLRIIIITRQKVCQDTLLVGSRKTSCKSLKYETVLKFASLDQI